jgi:hypothetical protein
VLSVPNDLGFIAANADPYYNATTGNALTPAGTLRLAKLTMPGPTQVTNVHFIVSVIGSVLTASQCFAGLWDGAGNLIGLSADLSASAFLTTGLATAPLNTAGPNSPPFLVQTPVAYVGFWYNGTTGPTLLGARNPVVATNEINGIVNAALSRFVTANTGLTTAATAPTKLGAFTGATIGQWVGLS